MHNNYKMEIFNRYGKCHAPHVAEYEGKIYYYDSRGKAGVYWKGEKGPKRILAVDNVTSLAANDSYIYVATNEKLIQATHKGEVVAENLGVRASKDMYADNKYLYTYETTDKDGEDGYGNNYILNAENIKAAVTYELDDTDQLVGEDYSEFWESYSMEEDKTYLSKLWEDKYSVSYFYGFPYSGDPEGCINGEYIIRKKTRRGCGWAMGVKF